ncbi:hypothetical protein [Engelhardtia mirabilis]|uniref:Uncharacterized protein n=1 Tax=Engelhardtia mirabilis TaxID=2528011 RepID=A0A518BNU9_9BACT|nr:hypothetical protein Pla133_37530 [Planctomycetes bacterium Pla133]QDV02978.1 hypothetical protein Pla86_37520 [Planctomycetes bacterium Pla86]
MDDRRRVRDVRGALALASLALRRALSPWAVVATALWLTLLATRDWMPASVRLVGELDPSTPAVAAAQARSGVLGAALALVAPLVLWRVAALNARTQGPERAGFAAAPVGELPRQVGLWLGACAGAALHLLACAAAAELAAGAGSEPVRPVVGRLDNPALNLLVEGEVERFELPPLPARAERIQVELVVLPAADPSATVELRVRRLDGDGPGTSASSTFAGRRALSVDLPPGSGTLLVELARPAVGAGVGVPANSLLVLGSPRPGLLASLALAARTWLGLALAAALLPLLTRGLSAGLAGTLLASLWIAAWRGAPLVEHLPAATLFDDLSALSLGLSPGAPPLISAGLALGLSLACLSATALLERRRGGATR